jgi:hypothetical protein
MPRWTSEVATSSALSVLSSLAIAALCGIGKDPILARSTRFSRQCLHAHALASFICWGGGAVGSCLLTNLHLRLRVSGWLAGWGCVYLSVCVSVYLQLRMCGRASQLGVGTSCSLNVSQLGPVSIYILCLLFFSCIYLFSSLFNNDIVRVHACIHQCVSYSIQNGCNLSRAQIRYFKHNDVADLERVLLAYEEEHTRLRCVELERGSYAWLPNRDQVYPIGFSDEEHTRCI